MVRFGGDKAKADAVYAGCEPLTPDDVAEVVVFAAGRRENVVLADSLIFPNHQVSSSSYPLGCILHRLTDWSCEGSSNSDLQKISKPRESTWKVQTNTTLIGKGRWSITRLAARDACPFIPRKICNV